MPLLLVVLSVLGLCGCTEDEKPYIERPLVTLYQKGFQELCDKDYDNAADSFDEVERQHPYSSWAAKAQLMAAYAAYKAQKFDRAAATADLFIALHPSSPYISYAYYLRALAYYTNIGPVFRDRENADLALQAFDEVIRRFPYTDYAQDAKLKSDFIKEHLASQDMLIGKQYLREKHYIAALRRFSGIIVQYPCSILMPEVLYRIVELQIALNLFDEAKKTLAMLRHNFPNNEWTGLAASAISYYATPPVKKKR